MNQTEAWETVFLAAQLAADSWSAHLGSKKKTPILLKGAGDKDFDLHVALRKVAPRVHRMRARLDFSRARKAGKLNRPSWATP